MKIYKQLIRLSLLTLISLLSVSFTLAQESTASGKVVVTSASVATNSSDDDETKGSVVRGRVFYQDTARPLRRGWIGLKKIRELVQPKTDDESKGVALTTSSGYESEKYVLTNDEGEFVMKGVKAGIYQPITKVQGVLSPNYNDRENPDFQQITVDGFSEIQINISFKRGGAISGRVFYSDGEPVIGAKMQIVVKKDDNFLPYSGDRFTRNVSETDDRGFYRFSGLPANEYVVLVSEPSVQNGTGIAMPSYDINNSNTLLKTFYPSASEIKDAQAISVLPGQEQSDINLIIPDRHLLKISGLVVAKNKNVPLKNIRISFQKIDDNLSFDYSSEQTRQTETDAQGNWTLIDLPSGKYRVTANSNESYYYSGQTDTEDNQPKYAPISKEIEINNENLADILFELPLQATISGTITVENNKPLPDLIFLSVVDEKSKKDSTTYVNNRNNKNNQSQKSSSEFRIGGLSEGKFYIAASINEGKYFVKSITLGNKDITNTPFEIKDEESVEGVRIVLSTNVGNVKGRISNYKSGERVFAVLIPTGKSSILALRSTIAQSNVDPNGEFEINAAPGEYFAVVVTERNRPKSENDLEEWFTNLTKSAQKISVKAGETINITLDYPNN